MPKGSYLKRLIVWILLVSAGSVSSAVPSEIMPFSTRNQNPLIGVFGLPPAESATVLRAGKTLYRLGVNAANSYSVDFDSGERIVLDGETWRVDLAVRYGLVNGVELGMEIPYLFHSGGVFDPVIDGWHDALGLPTGGREFSGNNRLNYRYIHDGQVLVNVDKAGSGLGDARVFCAFQLVNPAGGNGRSLSLHAGLKLPTGSSGDLTGSGGTDLSISLAGSDSALFARSRISVYGSGGILFTGDGKVLDHLQRHLVGFGTVGMGWRALRWLTPKIQLDWHTPFYRNSQLDQISSWSAQLVLGGTITFKPDTALDVAIVEDIAVDTAPDVVLHLALRKRF